MLLNYSNLWLCKQIPCLPCHSFPIPTLKVIKSENFNFFCVTIFVYNSYTKGCKIHPRITTFYGIIFSLIFCHNFLPKPLGILLHQKRSVFTSQHYLSLFEDICEMESAALDHASAIAATHTVTRSKSRSSFSAAHIPKRHLRLFIYVIPYL